MKRFLYVLLSFAAVSFAVGCSEDDTITPAPEDPIENPLVYEVDQVVFGSQKSEKVVTLQNIESDNFMITKPAADKWVSFKKGEGNTIVVSVKANATDIRESKITAISGQIVEEIPIWQDAPRSIKFPQIPDLRGTGGSTTFGFTANIAAPFKVEVAEADQSWLDVTVDQDNKTVTAVTHQNVPKAGDRTGTFTISGYSEFGDYIETEVSVTQVGIDRPNYKFSLPDFSQSKVYKVMENGQQIAEICLEWLGSENAADGVSVDAQAVVVYPMASNGKADLSNGYVAKIVKANTGVNAYTYAAPTTAVHGGKVVWDTANNCISAYTAGTEAEPVETLVIPADNLVFGTETFADLTELTSIEPDVVVDNRPNDIPRIYPTVKVGTQYWLTKDLRARVFRNGERIGIAASNAELNSGMKPYCCVNAYVPQDDGSTKLTCIFDVYSSEHAQTIESELEKHGVLYNVNCITNLVVPDSYASLYDFTKATYTNPYAVTISSSLKGAYYYDFPIEDDVLSPEGCCVPNLNDLILLKSYTRDATKHTEQGETNANNTAMRRVRDLSDGPTAATRMEWADDNNITGLTITLTPRVYGSNVNYPSGNNLTYIYLISRTIMPLLMSNGKGTGDKYMVTENCGVIPFIGQSGAYFNHWWVARQAVWGIRCIRK
ncbi:MAG: hypothetical protein E7148_07280 [Rikenellaceae bacterium]|nr:hypothetical protein [Rikenellaceae bacterium]